MGEECNSHAEDDQASASDELHLGDEDIMEYIV